MDANLTQTHNEATMGTCFNWDIRLLASALAMVLLPIYWVWTKFSWIFKTIWQLMRTAFFRLTDQGCRKTSKPFYINKDYVHDEEAEEVELKKVIAKIQSTPMARRAGCSPGTTDSAEKWIQKVSYWKHSLIEPT